LNFAIFTSVIATDGEISRDENVQYSAIFEDYRDGEAEILATFPMDSHNETTKLALLPILLE